MWPRLAGLLHPRDIKGHRSAVFFQVVLLFCVKRLAPDALLEGCSGFNAT